MLRALMRSLGLQKRAPLYSELRKRRWDAEELSKRRWDAAETTRLNKTHWQDATTEDLNSDLYGKLETLRKRSFREIANNPIVAGIIDTYVTDLVGSAYPGLQVQSNDKGYNEWLEGAWRNWWAMPDINDRLSGPDMLRLWVRSLWPAGEFLALIVGDRLAEGPVKTRLQTIHPKRLITPINRAGDPLIQMGVERTETGRPLRYWIADETSLLGGGSMLGTARSFDAQNVIHEFEMQEPDQVRGIPWLAPALQACADLRDYDTQVLEAARSAADLSVYLYTQHPDAEYMAVDEEVEISRRSISTMPPGWQPFQLQPNQPSAQYIEFRKARIAEFGRAVNMPLMMIQIDSSAHNYSSARFDGQIYLRGLQARQAWLQRRVMDRLVALVAREAGLAEGKTAPEDVRYSWTWPVPPHVDPAKEAQAERMQLENGTLTLADALAAKGKDLETVIEQRKREKEMLEEAGLPPVPTPQNAKPASDESANPVGADEKPIAKEEKPNAKQ